MKIKKVLIIRFSSFGDIVQCASVVDLISREYPEAQIDWVTRSDFDYLVRLNAGIHHVWSFNKNAGIGGLFQLGLRLREENYDLVYDAHNNLRSNILSIFLRMRLTQRASWVTRSKDRLKRIFLFNFRINTFPRPFKGIHSYRAPLIRWGIIPTDNEKMVSWKFSSEVRTKIAPFIFGDQTIVLVPSAAWEMKRWPLESWKKLIKILSDKKFVILGGKEDHFCEELYEIDSARVINLAGKLSLVESCALIESAQLVISADTGLLHVADVLGVKGISLMGPTAFGFTTSNQIVTLEVNLPCRPCTKDGRGRCSQKIYQRCMVEITPERVSDEVRLQLRG